MIDCVNLTEKTIIIILLPNEMKPNHYYFSIGEEVTDQKLAGLTDTNSTFTCTVDGDNYVFTTEIGGGAWKREVKFTIGKPFQEELTGKDSTTVCELIL